jgi:formylglycine-generating enzyme required for sulfatase activity
MPVTSAQELVEALRSLPLLGPEQTQELTTQILPQFQDLKKLAREILKRQWLTTYQINQVARGKGNELLLHNYVLLDLLGQGGMGQVYKARHTRLKVLRALKVILPQCLSSPTVLARFQREVEASALLEHPNIVHVYDADEWKGVHYLAMECVEGTDLGKLLKKSQVLPVPNACDYVRQACLGLQHAHEKGLVHRDIKPSNLMLTTQGVIKILDMGLAHITRSGVTGLAQAEGSLTATGTIMGTPDYLAPEQGMNSKNVDIRADLYSLGCSLYHLLTGQMPFPGDNVVEKLICHQLHQPRPVESLRPGLPPGLPEVVRKMMAKKPDERYQTPTEAAAALLPFTASGVALAPLPETVRPLSDPLTPGPMESSDQPTMPPSGTHPTDHPVAPSLTATPLDQLVDHVPVSRRRRAAYNRETRKQLWVLAGVGGGMLLLLLLLLILNSLGGSPTKEKRDGKEKKSQEKPVPGEVLTNSIGMELVPIKAGKFVMGSPRSEVGRADDEDQHEVVLTRDFYLGKHLVTQQQYTAIMGTNPSQFSPTGADKDKVGGLDTQLFPVERVSWEDAVQYCEKLTEKEKSQGRSYRLPTEAEWEYACRAGTTTPFSFGKELNGKQANCDGNYPYGTEVKGPRLGRTSPVGSYPANPWGLFDMHGNVRQWCSDYYSKEYDQRSAKDPTGPPQGTIRVLRGGSWDDFPKNCRSAYRDSYSQTPRSAYCGFRLVLVLKGR